MMGVMRLSDFGKWFRSGIGHLVSNLDVMPTGAFYKGKIEGNKSRLFRMAEKKLWADGFRY